MAKRVKEERKNEEKDAQEREIRRFGRARRSRSGYLKERENARNIPIHYNYRIIPMLAHIEGKEPEIRLIRGYRASQDSGHYRNLTSYYIDMASARYESHYEPTDERAGGTDGRAR